MTADTRPVFAGYPRVSFMGKRRADAEDFHSVRDQIRPMQLEAERLGVRLHVVEPDLNAKGQDIERAEIARIWEGVESGRYQGVLVAYLSRLTRSTKHALELWERTRAAGGRVIAIREGIDSDHMTPEAWFHLKVMSGVDELQVDKAREDFDMRRAGAVRAGIWPFPTAPSGYVKDPTTRKLVPDRGRGFCRNARNVRWAFRAVPTTPVDVIADRLEMSPEGIRKMLRNRAYRGEIHVGGKLQKRGPLKGTVSPKYENLAAHQELVSEAEFLAAGRALRGEARPTRSDEYDGPALAAGVIVCAGCGHAMTRSTKGAYQCRGRSSAGRCPASASIRTTRVDRHIEAVVLGHLTRLRATAHSHGRTLQTAQAELDAARAELDDYLAVVRVASVGRDSAERGARARQEGVRAAEVAVEDAMASAPLALRGNPIEDWNKLDATTRNRVSSSLIEAVVVRSVGGAGRTHAVEDRVRVIAHGSGVVTRHAGGKSPHGIRPVPFPDLDDPVVLRV